MNREAARQFTQHRVIINDALEGQVNGVTETHIVVYANGAQTQILLSDVDTIEITSHVCPECSETVEVVHGEQSLCTDCYRDNARATPFAGQPCDECGTTDRNVWRDPITRRNEYFCSLCHARRGKVFLNRWTTTGGSR